MQIEHHHPKFNAPGEGTTELNYLDLQQSPKSEHTLSHHEVFANAEHLIGNSLSRNPEDLQPVREALRALHSGESDHLFKQDLTKINDDLHKRGILPNIDIVFDEQAPDGFRFDRLAKPVRESDARTEIEHSSPLVDNSPPGSSEQNLHHYQDSQHPATHRGLRQIGEPHDGRHEHRGHKDNSHKPSLHERNHDRPSNNGQDDSDGHSSSALRGNSTAQRIFNYLVDKGLTREQAAGVLGNLMQENRNFDTRLPGDNGNSVGIAQWNGKRRHELMAFANEHNSSPYDLKTQLDFMWHELNGKEKGALHGLRMAHTPEQAALAFSNLFERPGNPMNSNRIRNARLAYNSLGRNETTIA